MSNPQFKSVLDSLWAKNIKDPKRPSKIAAIHVGSQWWRKFKTSIRKISPWLTSRTGHFDGLSVTAGTFSIQSRLNIYKEKRKKIRQSTINSLHLPQNMITLNTAAKNFIDNRMPQVYKVDTLKMSFLPQLFMLRHPQTKKSLACVYSIQVYFVLMAQLST